jgi:hypothetical protein
MTAWPVALVALGIALYWGWQLYRTRSVRPDWRYPQSESERPSPISLTPTQFRVAGILGIAASLAVAVYALVILG